MEKGAYKIDVPKMVSIFITILGLTIGCYTYVNARIDDVRKEAVPRGTFELIKERLDRIEIKLDSLGGCYGR